ncbi:MAG: anaerobic ribonucleoside-triphosphate reductase activating protein [Lachnospiraceae bacterium]|nr:anaerobic ribonucleoside-triphosphate reductase activating protein [Lachnospiraceae bacterium]
MNISGFLPTTMLDYPGKLACTVFTRGCNLRCPFCQNASLVLPEALDPLIDTDEVLERITKRRRVLEGVCISGGEPTLQEDLEDFILKIRSLGLPVKLDTNGSRPEVLKSLLEKGLLDMVAMDVKNAPEAYGVSSGLEKQDFAPFGESVRLLRESTVPCEFRTTLVRGLHDEERVRKLAEFLDGAEVFTLQDYEESGNVIAPEGLGSFSQAEMEAFLAVVREYIPAAKLRYN